ncbi:hypothetical protein GTP56_05985 [Duganella sp. FT134W]|uniref:Type VII secretion system protein EssD-like domain-containing protein n=1 Tax=Duganella margarita TaxID=2692170 RepID=A0A7X4GZS5_9BURK|nr:DNA/RNA non-specific endonuclease [Duganella margarita]MYM71747.1 hypothetical protein [Duganella margarita]
MRPPLTRADDSANPQRKHAQHTARAIDSPATTRLNTLQAQMRSGPQQHSLQALQTKMNAHPTPAGVAQLELMSYSDVEAAAKNKKFNWAKFRTDTSNDDENKPAKGTGLGVETTAGTELTTTIKWKPVHANAKEGTGVDVTVLGPDHKLGSEPQAGSTKVWNKRRAQLAAASGEKYIAGHLLNNNLGGPGNDARNLTAIPATANTQQSAKIEEQVKSLVNNDFHFVHYQVDVDYTQDGAGKKLWHASKLMSKWNALDKDGKDIGPVKQVDITIPSPSSLKGGDEVTSEDNKKVIDTSGAATADVTRATDVILNNSGYLSVAVTVQTVFKQAIHAIEVKLKSAQQTNVTTEQQRDELLEEIDQMGEELKETRELLAESESELAEKIELLQEAQDENSELREKIVNLKQAMAGLHYEVDTLKQELDSVKQQVETLQLENDELRGDNERLQNDNAVLMDDNLGLQVHNAVLQDVVHLYDVGEDTLVDEDEEANMMNFLTQGRKLLADLHNMVPPSFVTGRTVSDDDNNDEL